MAPATEHPERPLQNGSLEQDDGQDGQKDDVSKTIDGKKSIDLNGKQKIDDDKQKQKKKYTRLSQLRRRRCARKDGRGEDESDLSEGFESEDEEDDEEDAKGSAELTGASSAQSPANPCVLRKEVKREALVGQASWDSGSEEDEDGGTAFDVETDSDMNSQESRSDLEDIEDTENSEHTDSQAKEQHEDDAVQSRAERVSKDSDTPPTTNGPLMPSDPSISSNLQAMSSQLFQAKRCFRLAPTFSNVLLRPQFSPSSGGSTPAQTNVSAVPSQEPPPPHEDSPCNLNPSTANGTSENGNAPGLLLLLLFDLVIHTNNFIFLHYSNLMVLTGQFWFIQKSSESFVLHYRKVSEVWKLGICSYML